jgi:hypothetical protein
MTHLLCAIVPGQLPSIMAPALIKSPPRQQVVAHGTCTCSRTSQKCAPVPARLCFPGPAPFLAVSPYLRFSTSRPATTLHVSGFPSRQASLTATDRPYPLPHSQAWMSRPARILGRSHAVSRYTWIKWIAFHHPATSTIAAYPRQHQSLIDHPTIGQLIATLCIGTFIGSQIHIHSFLLTPWIASYILILQNCCLRP